MTRRKGLYLLNERVRLKRLTESGFTFEKSKSSFWTAFKHMSSPRQSIHNYPNKPCPPGFYHWNNGFSSGCKPIAEDRRRLGLGAESLWDRLRLQTGLFGPEEGYARAMGTRTRSPRTGMADGYNPEETIDVNYELEQAARRGDLNQVQEMIRRGARRLDRALVGAAARGHQDVVQYLLSQQKYPLRILNEAVGTAAMYNKIESIPALVDAGAKGFSTALEAAAIGNNLDLIKYLVAHGARNFDEAIRAVQRSPGYTYNPNAEQVYGNVIRYLREQGQTTGK